METRSGTGSVTISMSETIRAWQAWIMSSPCSWPPKTLPSMSRTRQAPQIPARQSCGRSIPLVNAQSSSRSPQFARNGSLFSVTLQIFRIYLFHLETNWPDMPGMPDLTVIEGRDPHEDSGLKRNIVLAMGVETACHLQCPVSGRPACRTPNVGAIAREFAGNDDAWNNRPNRDACILFGRIRHRFCLGQKPARCVAHAMIWIELDLPHRRGHRREIPGQAAWRDHLFAGHGRSEEHTSELQSHVNLVCRLLLEKKKKDNIVGHSKIQKRKNKSSI